MRERTVVRVLSAPATLRVTPEDIARGEVTGEAPLQVAVETNAPEGARLQLSLATGPAQRVELEGVVASGTSVPSGTGQAATVQAGAQPAVVHVPPHGAGRQRTTLSWRARFTLGPGARPGVYGWPVQVQAVRAAP